MERRIIKECIKHGLTEHVLQVDGLYKCVECRKKAVNAKRRRNRQQLVEYKGGKCEICGYDKCIDALEFHHINPKEKEFGISNGNTVSFERMKKEADKCMLVCSNCHREIHAKIRQENLLKEEEIIKEREEFFSKSKVKKEIKKKIKHTSKNTPKPKKEEKSKIKLSKDDLIRLFLKYKNFSAVGRSLNVSDNAIRKHCKKHDLPTHISELKNLLGF